METNLCTVCLDYYSNKYMTRPDGPVQTWRLGEFYFIRCGPQEPVCLAEVTLLWEDQTQRHLLASARLYFLPEDTPKGRTRDHGEDEVLAVSRKMVVKVEDLVRWSCLEDDGWKFPRAQTPSRVNGVLKDPQTQDPTEELTQNPTGQIQDQDMEEKVELKLQKEEDLKTQEWVKVLSYPQYCRYRSLQRRTQGEAAGLELQDPHILALGGLKVALSNTRVMYCRDTFNHPTLENNASFSWQFSEYYDKLFFWKGLTMAGQY
uniref:Uncharacterized protein n=1 Tax=Periophthalmus magnuspinnatus TaxID=409849 RepID=A0A3B4A9A5_9GOBI